MKNQSQINLVDFLQEAKVNGSLIALMSAIGGATQAIASLIENGTIDNVYGKLDNKNIQGEIQTTLDVMSDKIFTARLAATGLVAGMVSEEVDAPITIENQSNEAKFLVIFDPLDGSSNADVNGSIGTIFSILHSPNKSKLAEADYLIDGKKQIAAGYALYGPCTMLVITTGNGTHGFTLQQTSKQFLLTHPNMKVPEDTQEYAINSSNQRFWEPPIKLYINECKSGTTGKCEKDFNMRWVGSMVAEIHRILMRGGIYLYPKDNKDPAKLGRLRLMYEASPMALLIEQAGGAASTGRERILDIQPEEIHQRIAIIIGSKNEVEKAVHYHKDYDKGNGEPFPRDRQSE